MDDLNLYDSFNSISVIFSQWKGDNDMLVQLIPNYDFGSSKVHKSKSLSVNFASASLSHRCFFIVPSTGTLSFTSNAFHQYVFNNSNCDHFAMPNCYCSSPYHVNVRVNISKPKKCKVEWRSKVKSVRLTV